MGRGRICFIWHDVEERKALPACSIDLKGKQKPFTERLSNALGGNYRGGRGYQTKWQHVVINYRHPCEGRQNTDCCNQLSIHSCGL